MKWQSILRQNFTSWSLLADYLQLDAFQRDSIVQDAHFPLNLPLRLAHKISKGTLDDPILKQFLPVRDEEEDSPLFTDDPVGDIAAQCTSRLLQKYSGRSLLIASNVCAMHCRFCFRRNYPYEKGSHQFSQEFAIIESATTVEELILSGGDPLSLPNLRLKELFERLKKIPHLKRLRFHTRFPIGIPERIDEEFLAILSNSPQQIWFVIHSNHPRELDDEILSALKRIQRLGIPVLVQAVLLKGVNDSEEVLKELFGTLANQGIFAYYLHQLDRVRGAAHFEVPEERGQELLRYLIQELPGYAVPKYVCEEAGEKAKTWLHPFQSWDA
jgi:EF-P beta-lysylation protein EpmB